MSADSGVAQHYQSNLWQNSSTLEFRPLNALTASITARQTLDLRDYDRVKGLPDSANRAAAARADRISLFGGTLGLERERVMASFLDFRPGIASWFQPSFRYSSTFSLYKDPNARTLLRDATDTIRYRLPKRLGALQTMDAALQFDIGRLIQARSMEKSRTHRFGQAIFPLTASWTRSLISSYDNTAINPHFRFQLGLGGVASFRGLNTQLASGAGRVSNVTAGTGVRLPLAFTFNTRLQQGNSQTWARRVIDDVQALITNDNHTYPDAELRWNLTPVKANKIYSGISASLGYVVNENKTLVLNEIGGVVEQSRARTESQPMSLQVNWSVLDGFRTGATITRSLRVESRPGSVTRNDNPLYQSYNIGKDFKLPENWKARSKLKTSASFVSEGAISVVQDAPSLAGLYLGTGVPSVLTNNGRRQVNFSADTDLSETMSFSFTGSKTTVFDRNYNRQSSVTVFSTVLQLHFGAGEMK